MVGRAPLTRAVAILGVATLAACSSSPDEGLGQSSAPLTAYCDANVKGIGNVPTEEDYLPHVVHCENGGAPFESLKAQAIVARTYLYYKMETSGAIADGTGDQVYSCGSAPTAEQIQAVKDTAGQVLRYKGVTLCSFFVAGGAASPPGCVGDTAASTEKYVTYNDGKSGADVTQSTLGWVSPTNYRNRGCLSQLGSRCLDKSGKTAEEILHFYYGTDVVLETATGACVPTVVDAGPTDTGAPTVDSATTADTAVDDAIVAEDAAPAEAGVDAGKLDPASDVYAEGEITGSCACSTPGTTSIPMPLSLGLLLLLFRRKR